MTPQNETQEKCATKLSRHSCDLCPLIHQFVLRTKPFGQTKIVQLSFFKPLQYIIVYLLLTTPIQSLIIRNFQKLSSRHSCDLCSSIHQFAENTTRPFGDYKLKLQSCLNVIFLFLFFTKR